MDKSFITFGPDIFYQSFKTLQRFSAQFIDVYVICFLIPRYILTLFQHFELSHFWASDTVTKYL